MAVEKQTDDLEAQKAKNQKIENFLMNFGKNPEEDGKRLEKSNFGIDVVNAMVSDIEEKSAGINDPESKEEISKKLGLLKDYIKLGKLSPEQAKKLSEIYKSINIIQSTEVAEDNVQAKKSKKSIDTKDEKYIELLKEAIEKLEKLLKNNHEDKMKQQEENAKKIGQIAELERKDPNEVPPIGKVFEAQSPISETSEMV